MVAWVIEKLLVEFDEGFIDFLLFFFFLFFVIVFDLFLNRVGVTSFLVSFFGSAFVSFFLRFFNIALIILSLMY